MSMLYDKYNKTSHILAYHWSEWIALECCRQSVLAIINRIFAKLKSQLQLQLDLASLIISSLPATHPPTSLNSSKCKLVNVRQLSFP